MQIICSLKLSYYILIFSFFFSNFHILNKKLVSNKYLEETQYIDPDKVFSYTNYDVYGNWYWRQKINGVKIFKLAPEHMEATASNDGTMLGFTTIVKLALAAHCPAFGVNI